MQFSYENIMNCSINPYKPAFADGDGEATWPVAPITPTEPMEADTPHWMSLGGQVRKSSSPAIQRGRGNYMKNIP